VLDVVIAIRRPSDYRHDEGARFELHIEKGRSLFGKDAAPFEAKLQADARGAPVWTVSDVEVHQAKQIMELFALDMKPAEIAQELGISKATVYRRLKGNGAGKEAAHA
jgi:putative DNA primase/helicase